ncbi:MAG: pyridoxal phosphate-dependent aminotransferase [Pseudomonadota bacterium]
MAAAARAAELKAAGVDVISLTVGEPDFETPEHIVEAALEAMRRGDTRYTAADGTPALKEAVARKFKRENGLDYAPEQISVGAGAKQVILNAFLASLAPGDEVVIPTPSWVSYADMVRLAEGEPVIVPCSADEGFKLTPAALEAALTERTRWLLLNSPGNPTGAIYTADELRALGDVLAGYPLVHVMMDDIYEHIRFDGLPFATMAEAVPGLYDRTLTINGVSKAYAMTGWRIGYAGGPVGLIRGMKTIASQSTTNPSSVSQAAAVAALDGPQEFLATRAAAFERRRDMALGRLAEIPGLSCTVPDGAFYLYPSVAGVIGKRTPEGSVLAGDGDVSLYLLEAARVATVQGAAFGGSPHVRMSIAVSDEDLAWAMDRVAESVAVLA